VLPPLEQLHDRLVQDTTDQQYDGAIVGAGGTTSPAGTPLSDVSGVLPNNGKTPTETIIYLNGIGMRKQSQARDLQRIANATGARLIGVHNATEGFWADGAQVLTDKLSGQNPAVSSLASTVYAELKAGRPVHLMAHSQGGLVTSRALSEVTDRLITQDGLTRPEAEAVLGQVTCETFASASRNYPDGPKYIHTVNRLDVVPDLLGLGPGLLGTGFDSHAGRGAVVRYFTGSLGGHGVMDEYFPQRQAP
jgi:pimeloyl-ACP methyl ester carboxylesterase